MVRLLSTIVLLWTGALQLTQIPPVSTIEPDQPDTHVSISADEPGNPGNADSVVLVFTGDNKLCGRMERYIESEGEDYPYQHVSNVLRDADMCFGNLESAITTWKQKTRGKSWETINANRNFIFKSDPEASGRIFQNAGFDVLSLANNHAMDYCAEGLLETMQVLDDHQIAWVGAGVDSASASMPTVYECGETSIGFLAYSMIVPPHSRATEADIGINGHARRFELEMAEAITALAKEVDIVAVSYHWGIESQSSPVSYQKDVAHQAIDAGADLIIGHHPHCLQGIEFYNEGVIAYSLGNFVFTGGSQRIASAILQCTVTDGAVSEVRILPLVVHDGQPRPLAEIDFRFKLIALSKRFETEMEYDADGWLVATKTLEKHTEEE